MKKLIIVLLACVSFFPVFAQSSDSSLYNELISAYNTDFYPGVLDKASALEKNFPNSPYILQSTLLKAESYFYLYDYDSAISSFESVLPYLKEDSEDYVKANFLEGRCYFAKRNYNAACQKFFTSCKGDYYNSSVCLASQCFYFTGNYEKAIPLFEYIIQNGKDFSPKDYSICAVQLINCYKALNEVSKAENLFKKLDESDSVLNDAVNLKWNFYVQLGIDNFNKKDYEKAKIYFGKASELIESGYFEDDTILLIYNAKIKIEEGNNLSEVESELLEIESKVKQSIYPNIGDSYYATLLKIQILNNNWDSVTKLYLKLQNGSCETDYLIAAYYYNSGDYKNAAKYLLKYTNQSVTQESVSDLELLASVYAKSGNYRGAEEIYRKIENSGFLSEKTKAEYAKVLFLNKRYAKSYQISWESNDSQKDYLCALNQINLQNWQSAKKHLITYISSQGTKAEFNKLAVFYKGYVEYVLEDYKNAYLSFVRFSNEAKNADNKYLIKTYEYAAKSALQNGDFKSAAIQSENLVKVSLNQEQKEDALVFCADIYSDYGDYEKAVSILQPYTKQKSDFAVKALFQMAKIYSKANQTQKAEESYNKIISDFPKSSYAEEALYDCAELYYLIQDYSSAESRFNKYVYKYNNGKFVEAALFLGGECNLKISSFDKCILLNTTLISKFPETMYLYGAYKNLITAYYQIEDYESALKYSKIAVKDFPKQAADDEIGRKLIELERIVSGVDSSVAKKVSEYEKNGKNSTVRGRIVGSELVKLYSQNGNTLKDAVILAESILPKQTNPEEKIYAATNAEFLADYYRKNYENKKAAQLYLKAAEYYRSSLDSNENDAAAVLYSAVEAFAAENLFGDARETSKLLKQLYPESKYAKNVDSLLQ